MKLGRNLLAGITNSIWSAAIGLAVVPFYLKHLGIEAYGLIGFFVTLQAVLSLFDMGLAPTINREVARCSSKGEIQEAGRLLHSLAFVYWGMAALIAITFIGISPLIAEYWLQSKQLSSQTVAHAVMLMGLVVACRWPIGLYQGALIGAQRLALSSVINMVMVTIGSLGAVIILAYVSPTIEAFFLWQGGIGIVYALIIRNAAWNVLGRQGAGHFEIEELKKIWKFSVGMTGIAIAGAVLTQLDKVLLSKMLSLDDFGRYALAGVVASALYVLITPTFNVIFPRLSLLAAEKETIKMVAFYRAGSRFFSSVLVPFALTTALLSEDIVLLWTGNHTIASSLAPIVALLLVGTALNGIMHFPYALQLAFGITRISLITTTVLIVIFAPLIVFLTQRYGAVGGGMAWLILNVAYLFFGTWLTHRYLLKGMGLSWLVRDIGGPLCISSIIILGGHLLFSPVESIFINVLIGYAMALIAFLACMLIFMQSETKRVYEYVVGEFRALRT
ncbi:MAG: oligosaccharide flippase family protein [Gallionellaceae bacterium]|nr:oligosaccharide flippase family protein [Gallionellaceae bacterium]